MQFLMIYRPAAPRVNAPPQATSTMSMRDYAEEKAKAGVLLSQGMFGPAPVEVRLDGGNLSVTPIHDVPTGYAFISASSREEAIDNAREFLLVAGDGVTEVRQIADEPSR